VLAVPLTAFGQKAGGCESVVAHYRICWRVNRSDCFFAESRVAKLQRPFTRSYVMHPFAAQKDHGHSGMKLLVEC